MWFLGKVKAWLDGVGKIPESTWIQIEGSLDAVNCSSSK
jgi:hypothetical protein